MEAESNYETLHLQGQEALDKVRSLLKEFRSTMLITKALGADRDIHSRPMGVQGDPDKFVGTLWFFTDRNCQKVREIQANPAVSLVFQSDSDNAYMHLYGTAQQVDDAAKMKELYTPLLKTWFPEGLDDPRLTLLRVNVDRGNFWDSPGGMLQVLGAFTKAIITGQRGQGGEMGEVRLQ
ncbi:general stress protein [Bryobacterales bacterium F-183]|nr:general stress protein [Bryobacterales bacterium F-183]